MVVGTGRGRELPAIVDALVAHDGGRVASKAVAEVRSAIALDRRPARRAWPTPSSKATGKEVEVKVVVDPSVLGGVVAQVGDTVIDGSVRNRLDQLKHAF